MDRNNRSSKFELCRIAAMICVMLFHTTFFTFGTDVSWGIILLACFSAIGVNVFVMITGYFTTKPKKTAILNLLFICIFWGILKIATKKVMGLEINGMDYFFVTNSNWFIPSYLCLVFFAPVLNSYCEKTGKTSLWGGVLSLLIIEVYFDWIPPQPSFSLGTQGGYSVLSFMIIYMLARAIKIYGLSNWLQKYTILIFVVSSLITTGMALMLENMRWWCIAYTNPFVIISSAAFFCTFERMRNWNSKVINWIAKSMLSCLLGHIGLATLYKAQFSFLYTHYSGIILISLWLSAVLVAFIVCVLIDQLRLFLWNKIELLVKKTRTNNKSLVENNG